MQFSTIIADPPWAYAKVSKRSDRKILKGYSDKEYLPLTTSELCALPVGDLAAPGCVLLMWTTWPFIGDALKVSEAWGFEHVTGLPWVKITKNDRLDYGVGYWMRGASEPILLSKKPGGPSHRRPWLGLLTEDDPATLVAENLGHSRKPDSLHEIVEGRKATDEQKATEPYPGPWLELFARRPRPNWVTVGNEIHNKADIRDTLPGLILL